MAYYFTLPRYTDLSPEQQLAVDQSEPLALSGGPGTGKSVVCVWRHLRNYETETRKSLLLTYTKTLEFYLKYSAGDDNPEARRKIDRIFLWSSGNSENNPLEIYDEIIIDEAQDIKSDRLLTILGYAKTLSYGADKRQSLYQKEEEINKLYNQFQENPKLVNNQQITLSKNYRNSKEILLFIRSAFPEVIIAKNVIDDAKETGRKPIVYQNIAQNPSSRQRIIQQVERMVEIIKHFHRPTHNIAILVPYVWQIEKYFQELNTQLNGEIEVSKYYNELKYFEGMTGVHITTFKSSKGTEFDTVIIPEFDYACSTNIKREELYVAFTRSKLNLFLLCSRELPSIFDIKTVSFEE